MTTDPRTSCDTDSVTADWTLDTVITAVPAALSILNAHNIDTCCGGRTSLGEAAAHAHVDPSLLIALLAAEPDDFTLPAPDDTQPAKSCNCGCK